MLTSFKLWEKESVQIEMVFGCLGTPAMSKMKKHVRIVVEKIRNVQASLMLFLFAVSMARSDSELRQEQLTRSRQEPTHLVSSSRLPSPD